MATVQVVSGELAYDSGADDLGTIQITAVYGPAYTGATVSVHGPANGFVASAAIPAEEVPAAAARFVAQLHKAAGLTPPVLLDRLDVPGTSATAPGAGIETALGTVYLTRTPHGTRVAVAADSTPPGTVKYLPPCDARWAARALASTADAAAEGEPDEDTVDSLARELHEARDGMPGMNGIDRMNALTILSRYTLTPREDA